MPDSLSIKGFEPRAYQLEAAGSVLQKGNTLVVMPTALGKTYVALLVLAQILNKPGSRALFLAPTKPLASQQFEKIQETLELGEDAVCLLTGEIPPQERVPLLQNTRVICATPQAIENDVLAGRVALREFALIVFDEVHRAVGDYSYSFIAKQATSVSPSPLILGLTASPSSEREKIREICTNIGAKNVFVRSESDADVRRYVQPVRVEWEFVDLPQEIKEMRGDLTDILRDCVKELKQLGFLQSADLNTLNKRDVLALRGAILQNLSKSPSGFRALSVQAKTLSVMHALDVLDSQGLSALKAFLESIYKREKPTRASRELAGDFRLQKTIVKLDNLLAQGVDHPKFSILEAMTQHAVGKGESVIVFAHYRDTVEKIVKLLNEKNVAAAALVGRSLKNGSGMTQKKQLGVIEQFKNREFSVLVCTSVGEEGLDLTSVDLVIFFEAVPSEIRLIQRRGRAGRIKGGKVVVLVAKGTKDEAFHWISRRKEKKMRETLKNLPQLTISDFENETSI
ncbi:DEAD/DEAH box helicase [Candidatus Micrarchaeota archaeon]|nr:DEAD/DEAH box helicase [Candidatus Micrarchaeota archaeon]